MGLQPTASKLHLLLECVRPFDPALPRPDDPPGEGALYGTSWHTAMQARAERRMGVTPTATRQANDIETHADAAWAHLTQWLDDNWPEWAIHEIEAHRWIDMSTYPYMSKVTQFDADAHTYALPGKFDVGGTADLVIRRGPHTMVIDHKSGLHGEFHKPAELPQMLTLAIAYNATHVGILHSPVGAPPVLYVDEVDHETLAAYRKRVYAQLQLVGSGNMRPGKWCKQCPARDGCPAQDADLVRSATALTHDVTQNQIQLRTADPGKLHMLLGELDKLTRRAREELRAMVADGAVIERPDGKVLELIVRSSESLSKRQIIEALGPDKAEEIFEFLRKNGAMATTEREELRAR